MEAKAAVPACLRNPRRDEDICPSEIGFAEGVERKSCSGAATIYAIELPGVNVYFTIFACTKY
jgi:hypothetical protein